MARKFIEIASEVLKTMLEAAFYPVIMVLKNRKEKHEHESHDLQDR